MKVKLKQLELGDNYNVYCNETMASHSGEETEVIDIFAINEYANGEKVKLEGLLGYHLAIDNGTYIYTADMFGV